MPDLTFIKQVQTKNEKLVHQFGYHWIHYLKPVYWIVHLLSIAAGFGMFYMLPAPAYEWVTYAMIGLAVCIGFLIEMLIWRMITSDVRIVTNKRVIVKTGFFKRHTDEMRLAAIEEVEFNQDWWERLLRVGCLVITGRGGGSKLRLHCTSRPMHVKNMIENQEWK